MGTLGIPATVGSELAPMMVRQFDWEKAAAPVKTALTSPVVKSDTQPERGSTALDFRAYHDPTGKAFRARA